MERAIADELWNFISDNALISDHQFGFRAKHSTTDQLLLTYDDITCRVDLGETVDLVFFDFEKAFDKVSHAVLLTKLHLLGIQGSLLCWIECFLTRRMMRVKVSGKTSSAERVESGVPQGSVLGPILFLLYIDHAVAGLTCKYKIFADDVKMYLTYSLQDGAGASMILQDNINTFFQTSDSWNLRINPNKCAVLRFTNRGSNLPNTGVSPYSINNIPLQFADAHPDLGIKIENSLKFHGHIRCKANMAGALVSNLLCSTVCREPQFMVNLYISYIRPQLEYGSQLWNMGYVGDIQTIEKIQRRWTRAITVVAHLPYEERLRALNLYSMSGRLLRADLIYMWRIFNDRCAIQPDDLFQRSLGQSTRGHSLKLQVPRTHLDIRKRFFSCRIIREWNALGADTVAATTIDKFKTLLHRDLGERLFQFC